jgi:hypothetical protein
MDIHNELMKDNADTQKRDIQAKDFRLAYCIGPDGNATQHTPKVK